MRFLGLQSTINFYDGLRSLLNTDMSIDRAVALAGETAAQPYRNWSPVVAETCATGQHLAQGLEKVGEDPFIVALINAGERSSRLPEMCAEIVAIHRHALLLRNEIISRSIYPFILAHAALVIPAFPAVFLGKAPIISLIYGPIFLWIIIAGFFIATKFTRSSGLGARLINVPFIKKLIEPFVLSNTLRVLSACGSAGMLWPDALQAAGSACGNQVIAKRIYQAAEDLRSQKLPDLPAAMRTITKHRVTLEMINVGHQTGELELKLHGAAEYHAAAFQSRAKWTAKAFLGILYGVAMILAALQIISMYMNMYSEALGEM